MTLDTQKALEKLRTILTKLKPSGEDGFEGLVSCALSELAGITFRLARSGTQHGRDGGSVRTSTAILFEAKRYTGKAPSLASLKEKLISAIQKDGRKLDVWAACATISIGQNETNDLVQTGEDKGVSVLILDWHVPMPRLAVLIAASSQSTIEWFSKNQSSASLSNLKKLLNAIASDKRFEGIRNQLLQELHDGTIGFEAARQANIAHLKTIFSSKTEAIKLFGQPLSPMAPSQSAIEREVSNDNLNHLTQFDDGETEVTVLLGEEGVGKSWLVADYWSRLSKPPLLLVLRPHHISAVVDNTNPVNLLATLLLEQTGVQNNLDLLDKWRRRVEKWQAVSKLSLPRMLLLIDGINELPEHDWGRLTNALHSTVTAIGGKIVVTSRPQYFNERTFPRLLVPIKKVILDGFSDSELKIALQQANQKFEDIPQDIRDFIRNPRIFSVAIMILDKLDPQDLTHDRLIYEYLKHRYTELNESLTHEKFQKQLEKLARGLLDEIKQISANEEADLSFDAEKQGLEDIVSGLLFEPLQNEPDRHRLKPESASYAFGLLIFEELKTASRKSKDLEEVLQTVLDPIRSMDKTSEALVASASLACLTGHGGNDVAAHLIAAAMAQQNLPENKKHAFRSLVTERPKAFILAAEIIWSQRAPSNAHDLMETTLKTSAHHNDMVWATLEPAIHRWLSLWCRHISRYAFETMSGEGKELYKKQDEDRQREHDKRNSSLTEFEVTYLSERLEETDEPYLPQIDHLAIALLADQPLTPFAKAVMNWQFATSLYGGSDRAGKMMSWYLVLNPIDWRETTDAIFEQIESLPIDQIGKIGRAAIRNMLYKTGDPFCYQKAQDLEDQTVNEGKTSWRRIENYCDTDPCDPSSPAPSNIKNAIDSMRKLDASKRASGIWTVDADYQWKELVPGLARFEPEPTIEFARKLARDVQKRKGEALRCGANNLAPVAPLLNEEIIAGFLKMIPKLELKPPKKENRFFNLTVDYILLAILPHLEGEKQLDALISMPPDALEMLQLIPTFKSCPPAILEKALATAQENEDVIVLKRILLFLFSGKTELTDKAREIVLWACEHEQYCIRASALHAIAATNDPVCLQRLVGMEWSTHPDQQEWERHNGCVALVKAWRIKPDPSILARLAPRYLGWIADRDDKEVMHALVGSVDEMVNNFDVPLQFEPALDISVGHEFPNADEPNRGWLSFEEKNDEGGLLDKLRQRSKSFEKLLENESAVNKRRDKAFRQFLVRLKSLDRHDLLELFDGKGLSLVLKNAPEKFDHWVEALETADQTALYEHQEFGLRVARELSINHPTRAISLFKRLIDAGSLIGQHVGPLKLPLSSQIIWSCQPTRKMIEYWHDRLEEPCNDAQLVSEVICAQLAGREKELKAYIDTECKADHPARKSRALMIAGFMDSDDKLTRILENEKKDRSFIGDTAKTAQNSYKRNMWARHWHQKAVEATGLEGYWRYTELMMKVADARYLLWFPHVNNPTPPYAHFHSLLKDRLRNRAESRQKKRKETLFGKKLP